MSCWISDLFVSRFLYPYWVRAMARYRRQCWDQEQLGSYTSVESFCLFWHVCPCLCRNNACFLCLTPDIVSSNLFEQAYCKLGHTVLQWTLGNNGLSSLSLRCKCSWYLASLHQAPIPTPFLSCCQSQACTIQTCRAGDYTISGLALITTDDENRCDVCQSWQNWVTEATHSKDLQQRILQQLEGCKKYRRERIVADCKLYLYVTSCCVRLTLAYEEDSSHYWACTMITQELFWIDYRDPCIIEVVREKDHYEFSYFSFALLSDIKWDGSWFGPSAASAVTFLISQAWPGTLAYSTHWQKLACFPWVCHRDSAMCAPEVLCKLLD